MVRIKAEGRMMQQIKAEGRARLRQVKAEGRSGRRHIGSRMPEASGR
jgi:hypothetical protein